MNRIEWKRIVCALLAIILLMSYVPATASAASYSGNCGPYATWSFDSSTGVLTISGEYQISDYDDSDSPWYKQGIEDSITAVVINEGITKVGAYAFDSASNIVSVTLPKSLTTIKEGAFRYCKSLTSVTFKGDCPTIQAPTSVPATGAFHDVTATMYYPVGNTTYTTSTKQHYGGTLTWVAHNPCAKGHAYDANNICTNCGYIELLGNGTCGTNITWTLDVNGTLTISGSGYVTSNPWDKKSVKTVVLESGIVHAGDMSFTDCTNLTDLYYGGTATQWNNFCLVFQNEPYIHLSSTDYLNHWEASTVSATCTDAGYTCEACSCGHERNKQTTQAALDHSWSDWSISNDATCTADGTKIRSCQRTGCNATETETIPSTGDNHSYSGDVCTGCGAVKISEITFPDANFRAFLSEQSYGNDGLLTAAELSSVTALDVNFSCIADLTGIEHFTALRELYCYGNKLTSLDVSKCTALTHLYCHENQLTSLDVSKCTALIHLFCNKNPLTSLDVSKNTALTYLSCGSNQLTSLTLGANTALESLGCGYSKLTSLDLSKCTALRNLYCYGNKLTSLDVSKCTALEVLYCHENQLTSLDVSKNTALTYLECYSNQLTSLDVSNCTALIQLYCYHNQLTSLDVSNCTALTYLWCYSNQLTSLDVSNNTALTSLSCHSNSRKISASQNKVDLSGLEADGFDIRKASNWKGGTVSGNILTVTSDTVTYTYYLGRSKSETFTLTIDGFCTHSWNAATCTAPKTCTGCGATEGEALGHSHKPTVTDPTCTEKGYTTYTCHCGNSYVDPESYTAALEHLWSDWVVTKPNCITDGTKTRSCQREGCEAIENETLPAIGSHSFDAKDICSVCHAIKISEITFPDDNFRAFIIAQGYTADDVLTPTQIGYITSLNISDKKIKDLTGIEYFTALTSLDCSSNPLTTFDLSKNSALTELICRNISLTSLDVSKNAALEYLDCSENLLTSLDLSKNVALENLYCRNNLLTSLTLTNTALTVLNCEYNLLTSLDVSQCTALEDLYCYDNQLSSLDLGNHPDLATVSCQNNQLTSLDVSKSASLTNVYCYSNQLKSLDLSISTTLKDVQCYDNQLTSLVLGNHPALTTLLCYNNQLTSLDVSSCISLRNLQCYNNRLKSLDVSKSTALTELDCHSNQLTSLTLGANTALKSLDCAYNKLTGLDLSKCTALRKLYCHENQLTSLDLSKCTALTELECYANNLKQLNISTCTALTSVGCSDNQLTRLDVSDCTALTKLTCSSNQLTSLDLSKNVALTNLICSGNQLVSLDVSKNVALTGLVCYSNKRTVSATQNKIDLSTLEADGFDVSKASNWKGGTVSGNILTVTSDTVTYTYDLGRSKSETFTLLVDGLCAHSWNAATCTDPKTCKECGATEGTELGHQMSDWEVTVEPTLTEDGEMKRACQRQGCDHVETDIVSKLLVDSLATPVAKTSNDTVTGKVKLTWEKVTGALEYEISRATAKDGTYTELATTAETAFIDTSAEPGTLYYYKVRATNNVSSVVSDYSAIVSRTCDLAQPVVTASNVASSGKIKLTWEKVEGVTEYKVYRATSKSGEYKLMKTTTGTSYTNTSAKTGSTYYYKVKAIHSNSSANSVYSEIVSRTCDLAQPVVTASNVASSGKIKLTWEKVEGVTEYKVYRATSKSGEYKLMKTTTGTSYTNTSAKTGSTYYYKVKAIYSKSAANSAYSEIVSRTCDLARPVVTIKLKNGDPRLTWEKVAGATEYQVYRATSKNGEYKLMKTTTGTSYTNTSAKSGKTYYYKVKAIHSNSVANSAYSSVDSIKAK